jgi:hypothetical protein
MEAKPAPENRPKLTDPSICHCQRCGARCQVTGPGNPNAKMLRRSKVPKGLCVNCALHDWLRHTYPVNTLLEDGGARLLNYEHVRQLIYEIMKHQLADACLAEINWNLLSENWELPWPGIRQLDGHLVRANERRGGGCPSR